MYVAPAQPGEVAAVAAAAPLASALDLEVGPFVVPTALLAGAARVEHEDSEAGAVTREFLREDPWSGTGSVRPGGWMLLARDDDTIVIGQRRGIIGLGQVVTLARAGGRFTATAMGGARLVTAAAREQVEPVLGATADGATIVLSWDCGADLRGQPLRRVAEIRTSISDDAVHVLLVSVPAAEDPHDAALWRAGTGMAAHATLRLAADLADRVLLTDHRVPAERLLPA